jgi:outer membrane receptor protein involved in Fe transport
MFSPKFRIAVPAITGSVAAVTLALIMTFPAAAKAAAQPDDATPGNDVSAIDSMVITAKRLNEARTGIETKTGASTYTIDAAAIAATPGGDNTLLNQVILQAPEVAQDSFGQLHVRGEHNGLQYRLNGIILPEGISVFGQSLDPRLIESMKLVTGALPAEYGLRTAGIIDLTTKSGIFEPHGTLSLYGGSHGTVEPSFAHGGSSGAFNYFVSGDFLRNNLGIESPDGSATPLHDTTKQYHGFGYFEYILDPDTRVSGVLGTSHGRFQIPNQAGLQPPLGLTVNGQTSFPSESLDEKQTEVTHYGIASLQHSQGNLDLQTSLTGRYSSLTFSPDPLGDLLYTGIAQNAYKRDIAYSLQTDGAYHWSDAHILRAGFYVQHDKATSNTTSQVLPAACTGSGTPQDPYVCQAYNNTVGDPLFNPQFDQPQTVVDNSDQTQWIESAYLQDEWKFAPVLTINYGLRFDRLTAFTSGSQLSPRVNLVWKPWQDTTVHGGYSRYFSPPPFELVGTRTISLFANTTTTPALALAATPKAESANYYDVGVEQQFITGLIVGVDTYYKSSHNLIDEGQFGAPIILTPFNYLKGEQYGAELMANYSGKAFSAYGNFAVQRARGKDFTSSQFNFSPNAFTYVTTHFIDLDHEQQMTASAGASYLWQNTRFSADLLFGSGLRASLALPDGSTIPNGAHLPYYRQVNVGVSHAFHLAGADPAADTLTVRFDVINVFDQIYQIRNGTGVGVGAPQFGPRRGYFFGVSQSF